MSADVLSLIAGAVLSLAFSYVPGLKDKFAPLAPEKKRLIMLGLLVVAASAVYGLSCAGWGAAWGIAVVCDQAGAQALVTSLILAIAANQGVYSITPTNR